MRYVAVALLAASLSGCGSDDPPVTEDTGTGADSGTGTDSTTTDTGADSGLDSTAADSTTDATTESAVDSASADSASGDSTATDSAPTDSAPADSGSGDSTATDSAPADSTAADSAADSALADSTAADSTAADSTAADSTAADSTAADSTAADSVADSTADSSSDSAADAASGDSSVDAAGDSADAASDASFSTPPTCDGTVAAGEYGDHTEGKNQSTSGAQTWYVTWDATNLYVAITNANVAEGAVVYLETAPLTPSTSGTNADGNLGGQSYDGARYSALPFRADLVAYVKSGYRELRTADGSGGWSSPTTSAGCFASAGTTREFTVPWSSVGGRPASFAFFGYVVSSGGYVYGATPSGLPAGSIGTSATAGAYYFVADSSAAAAAKPFATPKP